MNFKELAKKLNVTVQSVYYYYNGRHNLKPIFEKGVHYHINSYGKPEFDYMQCKMAYDKYKNVNLRRLK